ncbi:hypothetical protein EDD11_001590 [Mortierella claussenii]|nr:hypothetical protein EDD11_001590 [Mortierella claussenii]
MIPSQDTPAASGIPLTLPTETDDDARLMLQLQDELKNAALLDDDDDDHAAVSTTSATATTNDNSATGAVKMPANMLTPAEQEAADHAMRQGVQIFFENNFSEAQRIFASQDQVNPIYALGSGALAFMKVLMFV